MNKGKSKKKPLQSTDYDWITRVERVMNRPGFSRTFHVAEMQLKAEDAAWEAYRKGQLSTQEKGA